MEKSETTPEDMTIAELQTEITKMQQILFRKVAGDPTIRIEAPRFQTTTTPIWETTWRSREIT